MREKILYWLQLLLLPIYLLLHLFPRDKRLWLFGSTFGRRFADNPRYLYLYLNSIDTDIRPVWISHDKAVVELLRSSGLEAYLYRSLKGRVLALRGGVYIYDNYSKDINFWLSGGAIKVNLWHGVGNKRINHDNIHDRVRHPKNGWERFKYFPRTISDEKPSDYVLCTSKEMGDYFAMAFKSAPGHVLVEGYPRCDALFEENRDTLLSVMSGSERELLGRIGKWKGDAGVQGTGRVIIYLPTFRDSESEFLHVMDMAAFDKWLQDMNYLFVMKLHPKSKIGESLKGCGRFENIILAPAEADVYTFLGEGDMLVTDYSSVYTDYMLLERPVVAFCYDASAYAQNSRDCFIDQDKYMPELKALTMDELMDCIDRAFEKDERLGDRLASRTRMFDIPDGRACERVYRRIGSLIKRHGNE